MQPVCGLNALYVWSGSVYSPIISYTLRTYARFPTDRKTQTIPASRCSGKKTPDGAPDGVHFVPMH